MIESDYLLGAGFVLAWLGLPALVSAYANRHRPHFALALILIGGGCIAYAAYSGEGGYDMAELPVVFFRVIGQLF